MVGRRAMGLRWVYMMSRISRGRVKSVVWGWVGDILWGLVSDCAARTLADLLENLYLKLRDDRIDQCGQHRRENMSESSEAHATQQLQDATAPTKGENDEKVETEMQGHSGMDPRYTHFKSK
jgi:hypothetical protein